jgi:transposase InsO family protein
VIDYSQTINRFTQHDAYPLPLIEDLVHRVSQNKVFSVLDLKSAYHQIPLKQEEKHYTAFEANGRLYQFTRMPFGLTNAVAAFQRIMNHIISEHELKGVFSYLDDIIVAGESLTEHDENLNRFLSITKSLSITLNNEKCIWRKESINFLGYTIGEGVVKPDSSRLDPLRNLPIPHDQSSLRRTIGLFSYFSKWVPTFSDKISSLMSSSFPLNDEALKSFQNIKSEIEKATLSPIDENIPFTVETDASDVALAATLIQNGRPVAFYSRKLSDSERKYPSIEKEAYAIVESLRKWRHFLLIRPFKLITDQQGVSFMFNNTSAGKIKNIKIQRWRIELSCFKFDILYRPGKENVSADALSRACGATTNKYSLLQIHEYLCHPGIRRLFHYVRNKNLPYSLEDVKLTCKNCHHCNELKPRFIKPVPSTLIKATRPFERISIDFVGPKPSATNNHYILTVIDEFSRFPFAFPCADITANTVIRCLNNLFSLCGTPESIHSDRGAQFMSDAVRQFLLERNIAQTRTSPFNPAGNGQCERFNGTIWKSVMLSLSSRSLKDTQWELVLPEVLHSIRSLLCTSTNCTPHERFFLYSRRSTLGTSLPSWLFESKTVLVRRHVRPNKNDPLVDRAEVLQVNPNYVTVRLPSGRETSVSLRDVAPCHDIDKVTNIECENYIGDTVLSPHEETSPPDIEEITVQEPSALRRSTRVGKTPTRMNL